LFLVVEIKNKKIAKGKKREFGQLGFEEGWVEFLSKKDAKTAASLLNTERIGTHKGHQYYDDLWTMKYLPKFKWHHLTDQMGKIYYLFALCCSSVYFLAQEKLEKEQKLRIEISQAKKQNAQYCHQVERAHQLEIIQEKKRQKLQAAQESQGAKPSQEANLPQGDAKPSQGAVTAKSSRPDMKQHLKIKQRQPIHKASLNLT